jgi:hypothetical protein
MNSNNTNGGRPPQQPRGRPFTQGNPGRKPGSKNRVTAIAQAMFDDEAGEIMRKAIDMAKGGNERMLKVFVERILPKQRCTELDLPPIDLACDAVDAQAAILNAVSTGKLSPSEGAALASMAAAYARTLAVAELEVRMATIEAKLKEQIDEPQSAAARGSGREAPSPSP